MATNRLLAPGLAGLAFFAACSGPMTPTITAVPGSGRAGEFFAEDRSLCLGYAEAQVGRAEPRPTAAAERAALGVAQSGVPYARMSPQQRYDVLYGQCMSARGNAVPGFAPPADTPAYQGPLPGPGAIGGGH